MANASKKTVSGDAAETDVGNELERQEWSVISFGRPEAKGLTYAEAVQLIADFEKRGIAGLCIVTDDAAERLAARSS